MTRGTAACIPKAPEARAYGQVFKVSLMAEANRKMSPPDSNETAGSTSSTPPTRASRNPSGPDGGTQTIIQCPACQTKFLVGTAALKDVEFPRFHCSRCDHLFSLDTHLIPGLTRGAAQPSVSAASSAHQDHSPEAPESFFDRSPLDEAPAPLAPAEAPYQTEAEPPSVDEYAPIPDSAIEDFGILAPPPPPTARREGAPSRALTIPKGLTGSARATAPLESLRDDPQIAFDFIASSVPADRLFDSDAPRTPGRATRPAMAAEPLLPALEWVTRGWRGVGVALAPIGVCLVALAVAAITIDTRGAFSSSMMAALFPAAPQVAPPELRLEDTTYGTVALSSGETVRIITGTLTNESSTDVRNVVLEGLTFDAAGDKLTTVKVTSGATLSHSRLQSLTPDIITELQSGGHAKPLHLKVGESEKVTLALTDQAAADARFFSARVFSVR
jgi:hypothetical protein